MDGAPANGLIGAIRGKFNDFFFKEEVPYGLALVRITLPLMMLIPMLQRLPRVRELFSADGATCQLSALYKWGNLLPELPGSVAVGLYVLMIFSLLATSAGWMTRLSCCVGTLLYVYFNCLDAVSTITKYSVIATDVMIVMCVANSGAVWSIDSWFSNRRRVNTWPGEPKVARPKFPIWQARLIQLLMASVYFGAAITKIQTKAFFSGDQMRFWMLTNVNFDNPVGEYLALMPAVLIASAYITIVWEMCFIFTVWRGWQRPIMLALGIMFHLGTWLMLGLYIFPAICITIYFAFLRESDVQVLAAFYRRFRRRSGWRPGKITNADLVAPAIAHRFPQPLVFAVLAGAAVFIGVEIEYRTDIYGARAESGPPPLREIAQDKVNRMLAESEELREQDKYFSFDIGSTTISGILVATKDTFTYGDVIVAQSSLNPPHEDLLVECELLDNEGRMIHHLQTFATREMFRCDFYYHVGADTPPGDYAFVLKSSGKEVSRRDFKLVGTPPTGRVFGN